MKKLFLFDVDGTITESGNKLSLKVINMLNQLKIVGEIGIVGGGKLDKILWQTEGVQFTHYFTECGCVYNTFITDKLNLIYEKNIRKHSLYNNINILIKVALKYLSEVDYTLTGNFIDLRTGIIYISLIGLNANEDERDYFKQLESNGNKYRENLINILKNKAIELNIDKKISILYGGSVGIAIHPTEYSKVQIIEHLNITEYNEIHYFGDKYLEDGIDCSLLNHKNIIGHNIDTVNDTINILIHYIY